MTVLRRLWSLDLGGLHGHQGKQQLGAIGQAGFAEVLVLAGVRVGVDPQVSGQLVRTRKALVTARKQTQMGFFTRVGPDVSGLVLEPVEGLVTHGAPVGPQGWIFLLFWFQGHHEERAKSGDGGRKKVKPGVENLVNGSFFEYQGLKSNGVEGLGKGCGFLGRCRSPAPDR